MRLSTASTQRAPLQRRGRERPRPVRRRAGARPARGAPEASLVIGSPANDIGDHREWPSRVAAAARADPIGTCRRGSSSSGQQRLDAPLAVVPGTEEGGRLATELVRKMGGSRASPPASDDSVGHRAEDADRSRARARRRARSRERPVPRRRQQPCLPRLLRTSRGAPDDRRTADECAPRLHQHALQAARGLPSEGRRRRVGLAARAPRRRRRGRRRGLQGGPAADAGSAARAVPSLSPDRRCVRLPQPRVRGLGGRRRDRDDRHARGRRGDQDVRRLDGSRRVSVVQRQRLPDDDAARRRGRQRLHARARRGTLRRDSRAGAGLHRAEGRHERQHSGGAGDRRQDRRSAHRPVRVGRRT